MAAVVGFSTAAVSQTADTPKTETRLVSCTTNSNGVCTVKHTLGVVPAAILVTPNIPSGNYGYMLNTVQNSFTATDFKVRAMFSQSSAKTNGTIWFSYQAYAPGVTPPPPPSTTTPVPPPTTSTTVPSTTTTPVPTSTTPVPTTTTTQPPPAGTCPGGAKPDVFPLQEQGDYGPYFVQNDAWNWAGPGSGQVNTQYICSASNWWSDYYGFKGTGVRIYPKSGLNIPDALNRDVMGGKPLSTWGTIQGSFAGKGPGIGIYDVAWDLWLNGVGDGAPELMIWTENHGQEPAGSVRGTYTTGGVTFDVWWDGDPKAAYIAFVPRTPLPAGSFDLKAIIDYSISKGYVPANPTVNQINYGIEICDSGNATSAAPARFTLTDFSVTMK
jgi:hypothetical protein